MSKNVPVRRTKRAEAYAKKVRVEPPKQTRQYKFGHSAAQIVNPGQQLRI